MMIAKARTGPAPKDIAGENFDRLTAISYVGAHKWLCSCSCGSTTTAHGSDLRRGKVRSCGCLAREVKATGDLRRKHGGADTPEYRSWSSMIRRCTDPDAEGYHRYGGRGITVCERWKSFENFLADMGPRPKGTTLDREQVNDGYHPDNCRWADSATQSANTSVARIITANGKSQPVGVWARELGVSTRALFYRLDKGMSHDAIVNTPFRKHARH